MKLYLTPWLAVFLLSPLHPVTSQGKDILEEHMKAVTGAPASKTTHHGISFPNVNQEEESVLPVLIRVSSTDNIKGSKRTTTTTTSSPGTTTTKSTTTRLPPPVVNEVENVRSYGVASDAVHSVATRLHHLVDPTGRKNYLVSPFSVAILTAQLLLAARGEAEKRMRVLLTGSRTSSESSSDDDERILDLELHTQLGGLLKDLQAQGQEENPSYILEAASVFFTNSDLSLKSSYERSVAQLYGSDFLKLNFSGDPSQSLRLINQWAKVHTKNRIPVIYSSPLPRFTAAVILNSVYFKSAWETPFDPEFSSPGVFRLNTTHQIKVQYMRGIMDTLFVNHEELSCRLLVLPYKSPDVNMYAILPNKDVTDMKDFAVKLTTANITTLIKSASTQSVTVVLPKMTLTATYSLKEPIMKYKPPTQMSRDDLSPRINTRVDRVNRTSTARPSTSAARPSTSSPLTTTTTTPSPSKTTRGPTPLTTTRRPARPVRPVRPSRPQASSENKTKPWFDLSGASTDEKFRINEILHQVSLEVSETGTEAVAITSVSVDYSGDGKVFKADRPFLFFIRHEPTLVNLFYAVVMDPTNGNYD